MARIKNEINSPLSGKIGNIVACNWKGIPYLRSRPTKVNHPNTEKQLAHRMRLSLIMKFFSYFKVFLSYSFSPYAIGKTAFNAAVSENMKTALVGDYPDINIDYSKVVLSKGELPSIKNSSVEKMGDNSIKFLWTRIDNYEKGYDNDRAIILVYNSDNKSIIFKTNMGKRADCETSIEIPNEYKNCCLHCYIMFVNIDFILGKISPKNISYSSYCGKLNLTE